jgi:hypothetical protein
MRGDRLGKAGRALLGFLFFFALAFGPRISPIRAGTAFADDLEHTPIGHLQSQRFLNFGELAFWQAIAGPRYLIGSTPKIVACVYSAFLCLVLRFVLIRFGVRPGAATAVAVLVPLHPIWNTFIIWNVTGVYVLSLLVIVLGYGLLTREALPATIGGILLIALGVSGYQVHAGLLPALVLAERPRPLVRRLAACAGAVLVYLAVVRVAGYPSWGNRGLGGNALAQLQPLTDNLATVTQPLLSFYLGIEVSWRFWLLPLAAMATVIAFVTRSAVAAAAPLILPVLAAAAILPLNVSPTGPRVAAAIWLATLVAAVPLLDRAWVCALIAAILIPVSVADSRNWTRGWEGDLETVTAIRDFWMQRGVDPATVSIEIAREVRRGEVPAAWRGRPVVLENFQPATPWSYSTLRFRPDLVFRAFGCPVVVYRSAPPPEPGPVSSSVFAEWTHDVAHRRTYLTRLDPGADTGATAASSKSRSQK